MTRLAGFSESTRDHDKPAPDAHEGSRGQRRRAGRKQNVESEGVAMNRVPSLHSRARGGGSHHCSCSARAGPTVAQLPLPAPEWWCWSPSSHAHAVGRHRFTGKKASSDRRTPVTCARRKTASISGEEAVARHEMNHCGRLAGGAS